jgi:hypothetical protein
MTPSTSTPPPREPANVEPMYGHWALEKSLTEHVITSDIVPIVSLTMAGMRGEFNRVKAERGWPKDAAPLWTIRWDYTETGD